VDKFGEKRIDRVPVSVQVTTAQAREQQRGVDPRRLPRSLWAGSSATYRSASRPLEPATSGVFAIAADAATATTTDMSALTFALECNEFTADVACQTAPSQPAPRRGLGSQPLRAHDLRPRFHTSDR
jgi:hypothetical protein